jgi:antitoxin component YwqK of YwqJK toxin-antitoxin module
MKLIPYPLFFALLLILNSCNSNESKPVKKNIFYENGKIRRESFEINGKAEGKMTDFFMDGKIRSERYFVNGMQTGRTVIYYQSGKIKEVQYYDTRGLREKGDSIWYENGNLQFTAQFKDNQRNGQMIKYDTTGIIIYAALMQNDTLIQVLEPK